MRPKVGCVVPAKRWSKVDFPEPLAPMTPTSMPDRAVALKGCRACFPGYWNQWLTSSTESVISGMFSSSMKERWMSTKCSGAAPG